MANGNGDAMKRFEWWLNLHPLIQILGSVVLLIAVASVGWTQTQDRIKGLEKDQAATAGQISKVQQQVQKLQLGQAVLKNEIMNEQKRAQEFRADVKGTLNTIVDRLNGPRR